jgi:hypothetical protein
VRVDWLDRMVFSLTKTGAFLLGTARTTKCVSLPDDFDGEERPKGAPKNRGVGRVNL